MVERGVDRRIPAESVGVWTERFKRYNRFSVAVALRRGAADDSEDVAQDVWIRLLRNSTNSSNPVDFDANPRALVAKVTVNRVYDGARKRKSRPIDLVGDAEILDLLSQVEDLDSPELDFENSPLFAALKELEDEFKIPLILRTIFDCTYERIAEILDIPVGTVRSRLHRAKNRMKALLPSEEEVRDMTA